MAITALDQLDAVEAMLIAQRSQIDGMLIDIRAVKTAVPTKDDLQNLLSQLMNAGPSVIAAVTPAASPDPVTP